MSKADIKKLAPWLGWKVVADHHGEYWEAKQERGISDWIDDIDKEELTDQEAISLLPVLVERGYRTDLYDTQDYGNGKYWAFGIEGVGIERILAKEPTMSAAISAAVLALIEREEKP